MKQLEQEYIKAVKAKNAVKMRLIAWTGLVSDEFRIVTAIEHRCGELLKDDKNIVLKAAKEYLSNNRTVEVLNNILYSNLLPDITLHNLGLSFAYHVLPLYEAEYPNDPRPRNALVAKEKWLRGEISDSELEKAREAAWWAAGEAARRGARRAAEGAAQAAWNAAGNTAEGAARWAEGAAYWARDAVKDKESELQWQIDEVLKVLK